MQIQSKRINARFIAGLILVAASLTLQAQQSSSPASGDQPASPPPTPASSSGSGQDQDSASKDADSSTATTLDYLFNHKPQEGSAGHEMMEANQQAKTQALAEDALGNQQIQDPEMRAHFDKYLGMDEVPQEQIDEYNADMTNVINLLHQKKTILAWQQLYKLSQNRALDAGVSWELANRIESIWDADQTKVEIAKQNDSLREDADTANHNADLMSDDLRDKEIDYMRKMKDVTGKAPDESQGQGSSTPGQNSQQGSGSQSSQQGDSAKDASPSPIAPPPDQVLGKLQLTEEYLNSLDAQAKIKLNEMKVDKLFDQAKSDFADYITTLYKSGRYRHVLMAADFWRQIFDEGDYPVSMAQQVNDSLEISQEVDTTISVFNHSLDQKDIAAATSRLQEAFVLDEFHPEVLGLPLAKKKPIEVFTRQLNRMQNMIEARDFTDLETLLTEMKDTAPDFDAVKAEAIVNSVKLESELRLGKAKLAAQQGDLKGAMTEFQAAAEAWPENPDLKDKALGFFNSEDTQNQSIAEFDRLVTENNYRAISDQQLVFAPAIKDDPKRLDQLKAALDKVKIAETAVEKATLMQSNGDIDGAWETVQLAINDLPDDLKLNAMRGDLAGKGADFVSAINKAQDAESRQDLGYSLTWYAIAQRDYPASQIANQAIDRLSKAILAKAAL